MTALLPDTITRYRLRISQTIWVEREGEREGGREGERERMSERRG